MSRAGWRMTSRSRAEQLAPVGRRGRPRRPRGSAASRVPVTDGFKNGPEVAFLVRTSVSGRRWLAPGAEHSEHDADHCKDDADRGQDGEDPGEDADEKQDDTQDDPGSLLSFVESRNS